MNDLKSEFRITDTTANPGPLGLSGFGLTTILLNLHNAGFFPVDSMIMGMGIFFGGLAQVIVGILEWKKNNMLGTVAFTSYGFFWISLVTVWVFPKMGLAEASNTTAMGWYLFIWGLFSFGLWLGTLAHAKIMAVLFGTVVVLFWLLAAANWTGSHIIHTIAGYEGILCGGLALYIAMATFVNHEHGKKILPM